MRGNDLIEVPQSEIDALPVISAEDHNRDLRDFYLQATDLWGLSDYPASDEQIAYRQALRDITTHANWPNLEESDWPTHPNPITPPFEEE